MVASHNEDSIRFAIKRMEELDIKAEDKVDNLLSMAIKISIYLYSIYKCLNILTWEELSSNQGPNCYDIIYLSGRSFPVGVEGMG